MMLNIKELTQHVTTADRARFKRGTRVVAPQVVAVTVDGATVQVSAAVLSRIAKIAPVVDALYITPSPDTNDRPAVKLTSVTTTWTLYHQETK